MTDRLEGKVALITGAGSGIGLATAKRFVAAGATVVASDVETSALKEVQTDTLIPSQMDVRSLLEVENVVSDAIGRFEHLDILVNNAAIVVPRKGFLDVSDDDWHASINVNLLGYIRTTRAVIPHMVRNGGGAIIHLASEAALMPNMALPDYSILKSSVLNLSKVIAREFGPAGIRSNVVSPAFIHTPVYDRPGGLGPVLERRYGIPRDEAYARYVQEAGVVAGRLGSAEEVAELVTYLATENASFITGANYLIDGGVTPFI